MRGRLWSRLSTRPMPRDFWGRTPAALAMTLTLTLPMVLAPTSVVSQAVCIDVVKVHHAGCSVPIVMWPLHCELRSTFLKFLKC